MREKDYFARAQASNGQPISFARHNPSGGRVTWSWGYDETKSQGLHEPTEASNMQNEGAGIHAGARRKGPTRYLEVLGLPS